MNYKISQEALGLYNSTKTHPNVIRIGIRLKREVDPGALRYAVDRCAERFVRDFRLHTNSIGRTPLIEISAVNGRFILSFIQPFEDDR